MAGLAQVFFWALAVVAVGMTAARWVDVAWTPLVLVQSVSPLAAAVALVALGGVVVPRRRRSRRAALAAVCAAVLGVHAAIWAPWLVAEEPRPGADLTVLAVNLYRGQADPVVIARTVRAEGVDLLMLSELTPAAASGLRRHGVFQELPHAFPGTPDSTASTVIRSRFRLVPVADAANPGDVAAPSRHPHARIRVGEGITVSAVHPYPPVPHRVEQWRAVLRDLTQWARATPGPTVVAGDFNASVDHPGMRELLDAGLRDAHEAAGAGRPPTWPHGRWYPEFVHIDHVLVRGLEVDSVEELRIPGSDHDAVLAHLVVPAG